MPNTVKVNADGTVTVGTSDGDVLYAVDGENNVLIGGAGDDELNGGTGDDKLVGGSGNDTLLGDGGTDVLIGGQDMDYLDGGEGDDLYIGNQGADTFAISGDNSGNDVFLGFSAEDEIDLSALGVSSLDDLTVTTDANGNAVVGLPNGGTFTVVGWSPADLLANANFVLAPAGPTEETLGVNGEYIDTAGDQIIAGDVGPNGVDDNDASIDPDEDFERQTDTDTFVFGPGSGHDTITDFQQEFAEIVNGNFQTVPGDILDLSAYGIYGDELGNLGFQGYFDDLVNNNLLDSYTVTADDTVLNFTDGSSLTLLGIGTGEIGTLIEENMVRDPMGGGGG